MTLVISYDIGTTAAKTCLFSISKTDLSLISSHLYEYPLITLENGGAEQKVDDWWSAICDGTKSIIEKNKINPEEIKGISFCTQMQGTIIVDKDGNILRNPMIWLDTRSTEQTEKYIYTGTLKISGYNASKILRCLYYTGGGPGTPKDPLFKYLWIRDNEPELFRKTHKWLDIKDYLTLRCTGIIKQTLDSANLTWVFDTRPNHLKWSKPLCKMFDVNMEHLPDVIQSTDLIGNLTPKAAFDLGLSEKTKVFGGGGDAALIPIGAGCVEELDTHIYVGTSGWVATNVNKRFYDVSNFLGSIINAIPGFYSFVGEHETAGICLQWVRDHLALDEIGLYLNSKHIVDLDEKYNSLYDYLNEIVSKTEPGSGGVIFTPWMHGNRAPKEDPYVRGMFFNIGLETGKKQMIRAVLEGVAFHMRWMLDPLQKKIPYRPIIRYVGGGAKSPVWCQIMADILDRTIETVDDTQNVGAVGAAITSGIGLGIYENFGETKKLINVAQTFHPRPEFKETYEKNYAVFKELYLNNKHLYKMLNKN